MACLLNGYLVIRLRGFVLMPCMQYWEFQVRYNLVNYQRFRVATVNFAKLHFQYRPEGCSCPDGVTSCTI